jgi:hypothetical protein
MFRRAIFGAMDRERTVSGNDARFIPRSMGLPAWSITTLIHLLDDFGMTHLTRRRLAEALVGAGLNIVRGPSPSMCGATTLFTVEPTYTYRSTTADQPHALRSVTGWHCVPPATARYRCVIATARMISCSTRSPLTPVALTRNDRYRASRGGLCGRSIRYLPWAACRTRRSCHRLPSS